MKFRFSGPNLPRSEIWIAKEARTRYFSNAFLWETGYKGGQCTGSRRLPEIFLEGFDRQVTHQSKDNEMPI